MAIHAEVDAAFPWDFDAPFRSPKAARSPRVRAVEAGCNISRPVLQDSPKQVDQALWDFVNAELQALGIPKPNYDIQWAEMNNAESLRVLSEFGKASKKYHSACDAAINKYKRMTDIPPPRPPPTWKEFVDMHSTSYLLLMGCV